jgi:tRNA1Val (adenine37-N6)-methyltransferase
MKVCTDACLFGAIAATYSPLPTSHLLDIGTGTGLLSLMYAQRNPAAIIDAIEIDKAAAEQAEENFNASPWKEDLHIYNEDILHFKPGKKYDAIISNPPFFEGDLRSSDPNKNNAKHDTSLSLDQLLELIHFHLAPSGWFGVLLPYHRVEYFETLADQFGFYLSRKILVRQSSKHEFFRGILFFSKNKATPVIAEIVIKEDDGNYSAEFTALLKEYYLNL